MKLHANARTCPNGRLLLVTRIARGSHRYVWAEIAIPA